MASHSQERFEALLPFYLNGTLTLEQRAFVEQFLSANQANIRLVQFSQEIQQAVQSRAPSKELNFARVNNFLDRWSNTVQASCDHAPALTSPPSWGFTLRKLVGSLAFAATVALCVFVPEPSNICLYQDALDGRADVKLVLAKNKSLNDTDILEHLTQAHAVIVGQNFDGTHQHIDVDLDGRCLNQDTLIHGLESAGYLTAYSLLAH